MKTEDLMYDLVGLLGAEPVDEDLNMVKSEGAWEEFTAVMDSGAAESVAPLEAAPNVPMQASRGSKSGQKFHTADGTKLPNHGEKNIVAITDEGRSVAMKYQVADITKPLCSVGKVTDSNNLVCFNREGGIIYHLGSKKITPFKREGGVYVLRTWISRDGTSTESDFGRQG